MIRYFEEPLVPGWVYPCTLDEMKDVLSRLPEADLEGLAAVGLHASTKKRWAANAQYDYRKAGSRITLWSIQDTFRYRLDPNIKRGPLTRFLVREMEFGARLVEAGARFEVVWGLEEYRDFMLYHVLLHEVGHHVHFSHQARAGHKTGRLSHNFKEQFAEAYACRIRLNVFPEIQATLPR